MLQYGHTIFVMSDSFVGVIENILLPSDYIVAHIQVELVAVYSVLHNFFRRKDLLSTLFYAIICLTLFDATREVTLTMSTNKRTPPR